MIVVEWWSQRSRSGMKNDQGTTLKVMRRTQMRKSDIIDNVIQEMEDFGEIE
jgi:hypothetical protein